MNKKTVLTNWQVREYDVWGNKDDGYYVNYSVVTHRSYAIRCKVHTANPGTEQEFDYADPSDYQLQSLFGVRCALDISGDDIYIFVNRASDGYPIGELDCISHRSLSPIREWSK